MATPKANVICWAIRGQPQQRLGKDGTEVSRPCKPDGGDNQMNQKDEDIAHPGMVSKPEKHPIFARFSNSPWTGQK
jgi:hypothetical protein